MGKHIVIEAATPEALVLKLIDVFDQKAIETAVEMLIDLLDAAYDPDADCCAAGDDLGTRFNASTPRRSDAWPGDPDDAEDDDSDCCECGEDLGTPYGASAPRVRRDPPFGWISRSRLVLNPTSAG